MSEIHSADGVVGLRKRIVSASAWAVASTVANNAIRFASNVLLARLLFPEAFGMMGLASAVLTGLEMFTDLGIGPSIIRNQSPTRAFIDTLWSLQLVRGWGLWAASVIVAYPVALWYGQPELGYLIPALGLTSVVRVYGHTSQYTLNRELKLRELFLLETGSYLINVIVCAIAAYEMRSVWALVIGGLVGAVTRSSLSYWLAAGPRNRWCWDRDVLSRTRGFSRWILLTTIFTYIMNQGNWLLLGLFASMSYLGKYSIANAISGAAFQFIILMGDRILFPVYGQFGQETTPLLKRRIAKVRIGIMSVVLPPLCLMVCFGDWFVRLIWDSRYHDAGLMVQILCGSTLFLAFSAGPLYLARGDAWVGFVTCGVRAAILLPCVATGGYYFGDIGLIWGIAVSQAVEYPLEVWVQWRYGVWLPWLDAAGFTSTILLVSLGFLLRSYLRV